MHRHAASRGRSRIWSALLAIALLGATQSTVAPADQYFGSQKMSPIGVRMEFMRTKKRYEQHQLLPEQAEHLAALAEDAYYHWAAAYPKDIWLPSTGYMMGQLFGELPGSTAHQQAVQAYVFVKTHFATTTYAHQAVAQLHAGPPTHVDPAWAIAMRAVTPPPSPAPAASASASASTSPIPTGSGSPAPAASGSPAPAASGSPAPAASPKASP